MASAVAKMEFLELPTIFCKGTVFNDVNHGLGCTTAAVQVPCKAPLVLICCTKALASVEMVEECPMLAWQGEARWAGCGISDEEVVFNGDMLVPFLLL